MKLEEALAFIQSAGWLGCRPGLTRIAGLTRRLGSPQERLRFIHIAGTNGKGSTAAMLSAILREAGFKTGLFTSPHLRFYQERIQIDGVPISDGDLCAMAELVKPAVEEMEETPTEFERFTAMAFCYFLQKRCDAVVLEAGLGGRLDCTNIIPAPEAAVITSIGLDHTEYLGNTPTTIAREKAGILKPGSSVVLSGQCPEAVPVVRARAEELGCPLRVTDRSALRRLSGDLDGQRMDYRDRRDLRLRLLGPYQCENAAAALDTVDALRLRGWRIPEEAVRRGLETAFWPGRFEVLSRQPLILADGAHNPAGAAELARCLDDCLPGRKCLFLVGVMADKDYPAMLRAVLPHAAGFIAVPPPNPRALPAPVLEAEIRRSFSGPVRAAQSVETGLELALSVQPPGQPLCVFGSLYQLGVVRALLGK